MTTILSVRRKRVVVVGGDGQVSIDKSISKGDAQKVRRLAGGRVVAGFAGGTADAFALLERLEAKLDQYPAQLIRACVDLAKDWRTDRALRQLRALMIVADEDTTLMLSGLGDVIEPEAFDEGAVVAIWSGGNFAQAAAIALLKNTGFGAEEIVRKAMGIAASIDVFTNNRPTVGIIDG